MFGLCSQRVFLCHPPDDPSTHTVGPCPLPLGSRFLSLYFVNLHDSYFLCRPTPFAFIVTMLLINVCGPYLFVFSLRLNATTIAANIFKNGPGYIHIHCFGSPFPVPYALSLSSACINVCLCALYFYFRVCVCCASVILYVFQ